MPLAGDQSRAFHSQSPSHDGNTGLLHHVFPVKSREGCIARINLTKKRDNKRAWRGVAL